MAIQAFAPQPMFNSYPNPPFAYGSVPGDSATGFGIRDIVERVESITPWDYEFLALVEKRGARTQHRIDWFQDRSLPLEVAVGTGGVTAAATTLPIATTDVKFLQQWTVLLIDNEKVLVNGPIDYVAGTAPIVRAQGGTTAATHAAGAVAKMIGTAIPEETDFVFSPTSYGDWKSNYFQRFEGGIAVDLAHDVLRDEMYQNGNQLSNKLVKEVRRQKELLNRALMYGTKQEGMVDPVTGNRRPGFMDGIPAQITTNVTDLAGGLLNVGVFQQGREVVRGKSSMLPDMYICSYNDKNIISRLIRSRDATMAETRISLIVKEIEFDSGLVKFVPIRDWPNGLIIGVRKGQMGLYNKKGLDWHERDIPVFGDQKKRTISADLTCILEAEDTCEKYVNYNTNLSAYPAVEFGRAYVVTP